ncbi:MAG: hypothetical protein DMG39_31040 [Acidobacteria bacterium]|nr:MAG: hypothetical protein DMG39_31040 [Acidobacteriota bacterium]
MHSPARHSCEGAAASRYRSTGRQHRSQGKPSQWVSCSDQSGVLRDQQDVFSGVLAWGSNGFGLAPPGEGRLAQGLFVSGDFFQVLGVRPLMGRVFTAADDRRGCGLPGAVISYAFWQRELGGDPSPIGRKLTLNYHPVEIIGVTPPGFFGLEVGSSYDVAVPICSQAVLWSEGTWLDEGQWQLRRDRRKR